MRYLFLVISFFLLGCVNKKVAQQYYKTHNYDKAFEQYYELAKRGFPDASYKISRLIYLNKVKRPPVLERKYALVAYDNGYSDAAIMVADSYFREKDYKKALEWYIKVDFDSFKNSDLKNYLISIEHLPSVKEKLTYLSPLEEFAKNTKNDKLFYILGDFYLKSKVFYNPKKAEEYLRKAYELGNYRAGVVLGIYLIKQDKKEGFDILKDLVYEDKMAAYWVGNYLYNKMVQQEKLLNENCITTHFNTPKEFFYKKLTIYKFNDQFTRKNIKKAYLISYNLGYKRAMYKLIRLDIEDNTYELQKKTYSGFDLNSTINYLNSQNDVESKLILAKIYEKYTFLNRYKEAKKIYQWYEKIDKLQAYWHLYQYEKRFENYINFDYLNYLVDNKFTPAIVELAYQQILKDEYVDTNKAILEYYAKMDNKLALNYLGSLYAKGILTPKEVSIDFYQKACILEPKPFYIPSEDLKIANYYKDVNNDINKTMTIYYYYAQMENKQAQIVLSKFYKNNKEYKKFTQMLSDLVKRNDEKSLYLYYSSVLMRYIDGDYKKALEYFKQQDDIASYILLGDVYANGYYVDFDPDKALEYYKKALKKGYKPALLKMVELYKKINIDGRYNDKIISLLKEAVKAGLTEARYRLAKIYIDLKEYEKAKEVLAPVINTPKAKYLVYLMTGKIPSIENEDTNYGFLLLAKAKNLSYKNPRAALYYAFRAMMCNTPTSSDFAFKLIKRINNAAVIRSIYNKAKEAPICHN